MVSESQDDQLDDDQAPLKARAASAKPRPNLRCWAELESVRVHPTVTVELTRV